MNWVCRFSANAEQDLRGFPRTIQKRVARVLKEMAVDPFHGNVKALQGPEWKGAFRRRIGDYRVVFTADQAQRTDVDHCFTLRGLRRFAPI
jgi:mRNA-degrading endonuclease RelE of RelBE toxin-antitoxin system